MRWALDFVDYESSRPRYAVAPHAPGPGHPPRAPPLPAGGRTRVQRAGSWAIRGQHGSPRRIWQRAAWAIFMVASGRASPAPNHPCEDLLYIQLQGRAPRAGPGLAAIHANAPRDGGADCGAAQHLPIAGWPPGDRGAPGAGCLPLALRATSAPARTHPPRPAAGAARRNVSGGARRCKRGHPSGARILKPCVLTVKSARCARVAARSLRASGPLRRMDSGAPVGGMARSERYPTL
jgi:hypothetical protein